MSRSPLLIFDFDGTLADSEAVIVDTMERAFRSQEIEAPSDQAIRAGIGIELGAMVAGLLDGLSLSLDPETRSEHVEAIRQAYREIWLAEAHARIQLFDGIRGMLEGLRSAGRVLTIATGKSQVGLLRSLDHYGIRDWFADLATPDRVENGKPAPDMVELLLGELEYRPDEAWVIGDSVLDIGMARKAGVPSIGVTWGTCTRDQLQSEGADHLVDELSSLIPLLHSK